MEPLGREPHRWASGEAASLFVGLGKQVIRFLVIGARGSRDIKGKVATVGVSERGCERISKPSGNIRLAVPESALIPVCLYAVIRGLNLRCDLWHSTVSILGSDPFP